MGKVEIERNDPCPCNSGKKYKRCCMDKVKRKYMSEFALHTYTSHASMFYPNDLYESVFNHSYHIYMINLIPKLTFVKDSLDITKHNIYIEVLVRTENEERIRGFDFSLKMFKDQRDLDFSFDAACKTMNIKNKNGFDLTMRVLSFFLNETSGELDCEILYIGQSFGKGGNRSAKDRLLSHSTLQKIQSEHSFKETVGDITLSLWEFTPRLLASFDGISKEFEKSSEEDSVHMHDIFNSEPLNLHSHMINITEAALINYFKPKYNEKYKHNFPKIEHLGYKHYYDLDYNSVIVEIDTDTLKSNIFTEHAEYSKWKSITYPLHSEESRKDMFRFFD